MAKKSKVASYQRPKKFKVREYTRCELFTRLRT